MKIRYEQREPVGVSINRNEIPVGTVFTTDSMLGDTHVYLRTYSGIVSLTNPEHTWGTHTNSPIHNYRVLKAEVVIL